MEPMIVKLKQAEIPVVMVTEDGTERDYIIREMVGHVRDAYLTKMSGKFEFNGKGDVTKIKNFDGLQANLLAKCLHDDDGKLVPLGTVQGFPATAQAQMFKAAQTLNGLDEETKKDESKNGSGENDETGSD